MSFSQLNFDQFNQWLTRRQLRLLEEAYRAAQTIQALEDQYFAGEKIAHTPDQSKTVVDYVQSLRDRQLLKIRTNLTQLRISNFLLNRQPRLETAPETASKPVLETSAGGARSPDSTSAPLLDAEVLKKLQFIDSVIRKYRTADVEQEQFVQVSPSSTAMPTDAATQPLDANKDSSQHSGAKLTNSAKTTSKIERLKTDLPRLNRPGFFGGGFAIGRELNPDYEQQVIQEIRLRRKQDSIALRWVLILLLVPLAIQVLTKNLVFEPILGDYSDTYPNRIELSRNIQEEFFAEFSEFKEGLEIQELLGAVPELTEADRRTQLEDKAIELWRESREHALNGLKNVLADLTALIGFVGIVYFNRNRLAAIRVFSNRTFLGLSDPAKVFLFILVTDIFVGFHSAEGWEVILEGVARHFGLPESKAAINTFIATVPVFIDSCIKFWIFSYLTRYSPSASAIYERMNT